MKRMRLLSLAALLLLFAANSFADETIKVGDVWYSVREYTNDFGNIGYDVSVTNPPEGEKYSGEIVIPETFNYEGSASQVEEIGANAFASCDGLTVHIPKSIRKIHPTAFSQCTNITIVIDDLSNWFKIQFNGLDSSHPNNPGYWEYYSALIKATDAMFKGVNLFIVDGQELHDLVVPDNVKSITTAFSGYSGLWSVSLPSNVKSVDTYAFSGCENLKTVIMADEGPNTLGNDVFKDCSSLESVKLSASLTEIPQNTFKGCVSLAEISLPANIKTIDKYAFSDCTSLTSINLSNISKIGDYAFYGCNELDNLDFSNCMEIGTYAFYGNNSLESLALNPNDRTGLCSHAFANCSGLKQIKCQCYSRYPGDSIFADCVNLESVEFVSGTNEISYAMFAGCTNLVNVILPEGVRTISSAFQNCVNLEEITIPESVTKLQDNFSTCVKLKTINIKSLDAWTGMSENRMFLGGGRQLKENGKLVNDVTFRVTNIQPYFRDYEYLYTIYLTPTSGYINRGAFDGCENLSTIYCNRDIPAVIYEGAFNESSYDYITVYVPGHVLEDYKQNASWEKFKHILPIPGTDTKCDTPTIAYENGKLTFSCDTEGATFISKITDKDIGSFETDEIELTATYNISVYAKAPNHVNSDVITATLCWINSEPQFVTDVDFDVKARPVLIQKKEGSISVKGLDDGQRINAYDLSGRQIGAGISTNGEVVLKFNGSNEKVSIIILKIGNQSIKYSL